jgi:acetyl-CoA synthetase
MASQDQSITSLQKDSVVFPPNIEFAKKSHVQSLKQYEELYRKSVKDSHGFWLEAAHGEISWFKKPLKTLEYTWDAKNRIIDHKWFEDGELNVAVNCLDRHLASRKEQTAILWQGEKDEEVRRINYGELHNLVCRFSNVLLSKGVKKGDRICIYMPLIPEAAVALLACARIGAIHSVVFGGFSAESLKSRIQDSQNVLVITADVGFRAGRSIPLKSIVDDAVKDCPSIRNIIVYKRGGVMK